MDTMTTLFNQTSLDSGALAGLSTVVHKFTQSGPHTLAVVQNDTAVHQMQLNVSIPESTPANVASRVVAAVSDGLNQPGGVQPNVDLARFHQLGNQLAEVAVETAIGGYVAFHAMTGATGYAVRVDPPPTPPASEGVSRVATAPSGPAEAFDSRRLGPGDSFATVLLRPGTYRMANANGGSAGTITVSFPVTIPGTPYRPPDPAVVECQAAGFVPASVSLKPAQGIIVHINTPARVTIDLSAPDDGPGRPAR